MKTTILLSSKGRKIRISLNSQTDGIQIREFNEVMELALADGMLLIYTGDAGILEWMFPLSEIRKLQRYA